MKNQMRLVGAHGEWPQPGRKLAQDAFAVATCQSEDAKVDAEVLLAFAVALLLRLAKGVGKVWVVMLDDEAADAMSIAFYVARESRLPALAPTRLCLNLQQDIQDSAHFGLTHPTMLDYICI